MLDEANFSEQMMLQEEMKTLPYGDVWEEYLSATGLRAATGLKPSATTKNKF